MKWTTVIGCVIALLSVAALIWFVVVSPRRDLDRFLRHIASVQIGSTDLQGWRKSLEREQIEGVKVSCDQETCSISLRLENRFLRQFRLAPPTLADASVGFKSGTGNEIYIAMVTGAYDSNGVMHDDVGVVVRQSMDAPAACDQSYKLQLKQRAVNGPLSWATVSMDSCASPENRQKALAINTGCLTALGGCKTIEEMLPTLLHRP